MRAGKLDVALLPLLPEKSFRGLRVDELARYAQCIAVSPRHPLARRKTVSLAAVAREPLIVYSRAEYPEYHELLGALLATVGGKPQIAEEHEGVTSLVAAVEAGQGIALVPSCLACMVGPRLRIIPLEPALESLIVVAVSRADRLIETVKKFIAGAVLSLTANAL